MNKTLRLVIRLQMFLPRNLKWFAENQVDSLAQKMKKPIGSKKYCFSRTNATENSKNPEKMTH